MSWRLVILGVFIFVRLLVFGWGRQDGKTEAMVPTQLLAWRTAIVERAVRLLPEPEAGLVLGVVMGYKSNLDKKFYESLVNSGTVHMVVASGYNVMLVATLILSGTLFLLPRPWATVVAILAMTVYALLTGGEVSVMRASMMGALALWSQAIGRAGGSGWVLLLTVWLMFTINPQLVGNISFQLSVAATFGVVIVSPFLVRKVRESGAILAVWVEKIDLITTLSAMLATLPIIYWHFGRQSLISPVSNLVVLPLVPMLMGAGGVMLLASIVFWPVAVFFSWPTYALAHLMVELVEFFGTT